MNSVEVRCSFVIRGRNLFDSSVVFVIQELYLWEGAFIRYAVMFTGHFELIMQFQKASISAGAAEHALGFPSYYELHTNAPCRCLTPSLNSESTLLL